MLALPPLFSAARDLTITDCGAPTDGLTPATAAIQTAIDQAAAKGDRVVIPKGTFVTSGLTLPSGARLHLADGAVLTGQWPAPASAAAQARPQALLSAADARDITITGSGTVCSGASHLPMPGAAYPALIAITRCKDVVISGLTLARPELRVIALDQVEGAVVDQLTIEADYRRDGDGITITDCRGIAVSHCRVNASGDGIVMKSVNQDLGCEDISVSDCTVRSSRSAVRCGAESHGGFRRISVRRIEVRDTYMSALALEAVDGGNCEDVSVDSLSISNTSNAFFLVSGKRNNRDLRHSRLRRITVSHVSGSLAAGQPDTAYAVHGPALTGFHNTFPAVVSALESCPADGITLSDISLDCPAGGNEGQAYMPADKPERVPQFPRAEPAYFMFGELPAYGLYVRNATGLDLRRLTFAARRPDYRPDVVVHNPASADIYNGVTR